VPSVEANKSWWNRADEWEEGGDNWSADWGNVDSQWHSTLLPRIRAFVPTGTICEIAPGYGRWSQYLVELCDSYVGVDLSAACVDACRARFGSVRHATFEINDGISLPTLANESIDFAFSFDSLVHVEADVIAAYLTDLARVLAPDGIAWLHHSNLGQYARGVRRLRRAEAFASRTARACHLAGPRHLMVKNRHDGHECADVADATDTARFRRFFRRHDLIGWHHERAESMSASRFVDLASDIGLACVGQELLNWRGSRLIDCISLVARPKSVWNRPNEARKNYHFAHEAASAKDASAVFASMAGRRPKTNLVVE
jgi:SAM-dependent methyltransferase